MSTTMGFLIAAAAVAVFVYFFRLHKKARGKAQRSRSRTAFVEREKVRDRLACRAAALSLDDDSAPHGGFALSGVEVPASAGARSPRAAIGGRGRSTGSTAFDPDMPSS